MTRPAETSVSERHWSTKVATWLLFLFWGGEIVLACTGALSSIDGICGPDSASECGIWDPLILAAGGCVAIFAIPGLFLARRVWANSRLAHVLALVLQVPVLALTASWFVDQLPEGLTETRWMFYLLPLPAGTMVLGALLLLNALIISMLVVSQHHCRP